MGTLLDIAMTHADNLIKKAMQGNVEACNKLVHLWYKRIYNYAFKYFADHDLAMEVSQKTFIAVYHNVRNLKDPGRFKPWLYRIAVNYCREEQGSWRHKTFVPILSDPEQHTQVPAQQENNPEAAYSHNELIIILQESLAELSEEQREVVIMREYEGLKFREIAEVLDLPENTVKSRMYYGLAALRKILIRKNIHKDLCYEQ